MADDALCLSVTRFIAAPPERVWVVMTEQQEAWWCPLPWRMTITAMDWRAGGRCAMVMHGPDGEEMPSDGIFLDVVPGVRWTATDAFVLDDKGRFLPSGPFMVGTWEIAAAHEDGVDGTRYTATARHWTADAHNSHKDMGFEAGWSACADQLAALCEQ